MESASKPQSSSAAESQHNQDRTPDQNPEELRHDQEQKSLQVKQDEDDATDNILIEYNPPQDRPEVQTEDKFPAQTCEDSAGQPEFSPVAQEKIQDYMDEGEQILLI